MWMTRGQWEESASKGGERRTVFEAGRASVTLSRYSSARECVCTTLSGVE